MLVKINVSFVDIDGLRLYLMGRVSLSALWNESFNCQQILHSTFQVSLSYISEVSFLGRALHSLSIGVTGDVKGKAIENHAPRTPLVCTQPSVPTQSSTQLTKTKQDSKLEVRVRAFPTRR